VLPGQLAWIAEASGGPRVWVRADSDTRELVGPEGLPGATFPAAADPLGTHQLVVRSTEDPHEESLWLVPLAGDGPPVALGFAAPIVRNPSWSPDGAFVVFESNRDSFRDLYRVERAGGEARRLTTHENGSFEPAVGPEGRIAYVSSQTGDAEIWTMAADGSDPTQITDRPGDDTQPGWVDGRLVWLARTGMMVELWRQAADGIPTPVRATTRERLAASPAPEPPRRIAREWAASPDGERIAVTVQTGPADIALDVLDADGVLLKRLDGPRTDENPAWSPDSQWLVFSGHLDDQPAPDLYVVDRNGEGATRLTTDPAADWLPRWTK
jgi:TolB protein